MGKVIAGITTSIDGYITGPTTAPARVWARGASGCTTGSSAVTGRTTRLPEGDATGGGCPSSSSTTARRISPKETYSASSTVSRTPSRRALRGFDKTIELEHLGVRQSPFATFVEYRVVR